jgi:hypothetical protein
MGVEEFDQLGEVGERARQPVDLVDDDHVDPSRPNVVQQLLERRPVHRPIKERLTQCSAAERLFLLSGQVMDRAVVQPLSVRTSLAGFPCFVAERDEPAQPLEVRVAERSRLEADEDYLEHRPRRRPVVIAVVQPPLRGGNRLVYDFDNLVGHGASHVFSPARVPRWRPQTRRR